VRRAPPWAVALAPAALGLLLLILTSLGLWPDPILYLRADLGAVALALGLLLTLATLGGMAGARRIGTARRRADTAARAQAADDRRRFLRQLDHELKNPLTAIHAGLANLEASVGPAGAGRDGTVRSIRAQAARLGRLAADLRKLADLETRPLERAPVDVTALLEEAVALVEERPDAGSRRVSLSVPRAPWPLPMVEGDRDLLFLCLHNLLDNAVKFTAPGDTVEVRSFEDGADVVVEVADTGPGIAAADQPFVWEELYRAQAARAVPGSGLGLALDPFHNKMGCSDTSYPYIWYMVFTLFWNRPLVRAVTARHHGAVNLRSRAGQGTVVTLRLPTHPSGVAEL